MYLTILYISQPILAANNRGEGDGNVQTLQKVRTRNDTRTVLSGYAIRRAIRDAMQANGATMWRRTTPNFDPQNPAGYVYGPNSSTSMSGAIPDSPDQYDDTLLFGYMIADNDEKEEAVVDKKTGKEEQNADGTKKTKTVKTGRIGKNRSQVEIAPAISTTPWDGDAAFTQGLKAAAPQLNPFIGERHYTRYQTVITANLTGLAARPSAFKALLDSLVSLAVGGNQSANASELTPAILAWRFHKTPGAGGLYLGAGLNFEPHDPVDLSVLDARCASLGINCQKAGDGQGSTIFQGLAAILAEATPYLEAST